MPRCLIPRLSATSLGQVAEKVFKTDRITDSYVPRLEFGGVVILSQRAHQNILPIELETGKSTPVNLRFS